MRAHNRYRPHAGLVQLLVDALGERAADALHLGQVVHARGQHALKAAEMLEQPLPAARSHRGDLLEARGGARLAAARAVSRDGETVRLVADLLDEMQGGMV